MNDTEQPESRGPSQADQQTGQTGEQSQSQGMQEGRKDTEDSGDGTTVHGWTSDGAWSFTVIKELESQFLDMSDAGRRYIGSKSVEEQRKMLSNSNPAGHNDDDPARSDEGHEVWDSGRNPDRDIREYQRRLGTQNASTSPSALTGIIQNNRDLHIRKAG